MAHGNTAGKRSHLKKQSGDFSQKIDKYHDIAARVFKGNEQMLLAIELSRLILKLYWMLYVWATEKATNSLYAEAAQLYEQGNLVKNNDSASIEEKRDIVQKMQHFERKVVEETGLPLGKELVAEPPSIATENSMATAPAIGEEQPRDKYRTTVKVLREFLRERWQKTSLDTSRQSEQLFSEMKTDEQIAKWSNMSIAHHTLVVKMKQRERDLENILSKSDPLSPADYNSAMVVLNEEMKIEQELENIQWEQQTMALGLEQQAMAQGLEQQSIPHPVVAPQKDTEDDLSSKMRKLLGRVREQREERSSQMSGQRESMFYKVETVEQFERWSKMDTAHHTLVFNAEQRERDLENMLSQSEPLSSADAHSVLAGIKENNKINEQFIDIKKQQDMLSDELYQKSTPHPVVAQQEDTKEVEEQLQLEDNKIRAVAREQYGALRETREKLSLDMSRQSEQLFSKITTDEQLVRLFEIRESHQILVSKATQREDYLEYRLVSRMGPLSLEDQRSIVSVLKDEVRAQQGLEYIQRQQLAMAEELDQQSTLHPVVAQQKDTKEVEGQLQLEDNKFRAVARERYEALREAREKLSLDVSGQREQLRSKITTDEQLQRWSKISDSHQDLVSNAARTERDLENILSQSELLSSEDKRSIMEALQDEFETQQHLGLIQWQQGELDEQIMAEELDQQSTQDPVVAQQQDKEELEEVKAVKDEAVQLSPLPNTAKTGDTMSKVAEASAALNSKHEEPRKIEEMKIESKSIENDTPSLSTG